MKKTLIQYTLKIIKSPSLKKAVVVIHFLSGITDIIEALDRSMNLTLSARARRLAAIQVSSWFISLISACVAVKSQNFKVKRACQICFQISTLIYMLSGGKVRNPCITIIGIL